MTAGRLPVGTVRRVGRTTHTVLTRDGLRLATDVYLPAEEPAGTWPALLERTPYSRRRPFLLETAAFFAGRGYAVVLQDVRGRYDSDGDWAFLAPEEATDGAETVAWIVSQPWSNGTVGTMGLSFSTANQQALAIERPPGLRTQYLLDGGFDYYHRTVRCGGAFELGVMLPYVYRTARDGRELTADPAARAAFEREFADHERWLRQLPFAHDASPLRFAPTYQRWFLAVQNQGEYGGFWREPCWNLSEHIDRYPDIPIALEASWFGHHVQATTWKFAELRKRLSSPVHMMLGPWLHGYDEFVRTTAGDVDFGPDAAVDINAIRLRWFDEFLRGRDTGLRSEPPIRLFVMGGGSGRRTVDGRLDHGGAWRSETEWPLARTRWTRFYLHSGGSLLEHPPGSGTEPSEYVFDPRDPVPTIGGGTQTSLLAGFIQGGGFDQRGRPDLWTCRDTRPLAERADVLVFQTPPLRFDVEVTGPIVVHLWISSSAPDTDFTAKLVDVYPPNEDYPEGYALNLTDGIRRMRYRTSWERPEPMIPGAIYEITIEPQATSNLFRRGHRIRLDISSSNFPRFDVNPNTGGTDMSAAQVARQRIYHDASRPSHVLLPIAWRATTPNSQQLPTAPSPNLPLPTYLFSGCPAPKRPRRA